MQRACHCITQVHQQLVNVLHPNEQRQPSLHNGHVLKLNCGPPNSYWHCLDQNTWCCTTTGMQPCPKTASVSTSQRKCCEIRPRRGAVRKRLKKQCPGFWSEQCEQQQLSPTICRCTTKGTTTPWSNNWTTPPSKNCNCGSSTVFSRTKT